MTRTQLKAAIEETAKEQGVSEIEVISQAQTGAAAIGDNENLDMLCDIKWDYITL